MRVGLRVVGAALVCAVVCAGLLLAESASRYSSVPKGITAEGTARGMPATISKVQYSRSGNYFILNEAEVYPNPVSRKAMRELLRAIEEDDRIGMSLLDYHSAIVYGGLDEEGEIIQALVRGDRILGGVIMAREGWLDDETLPENYKPKDPGTPEVTTVVYGNFTNFQFGVRKPTQQDAHGMPVYERTGSTFSLTLVPLLPGRAADGGFLPDLDKLERGEYEPEYKANYDHFEKHRETYLAKPGMIDAANAAEAASFVRYLKSKGVKLPELAKALR